MSASVCMRKSGELLRIASSSRRCCALRDDFRSARFDVRVGQSAADAQYQSVPFLPCGRQTGAEVVVLIGEVQLVEPITRVVAVLVEGLGAQQVGAGMDEGHTLRQDDEVEPQVLGAHAVCLHRVRRHLVGVDVEERLVVVGLDVDDLLLGILGVAGRAAVVVHLGAGHGGAGAIHKGVVSQVAGQIRRESGRRRGAARSSRPHCPCSGCSGRSRGR